MPETIQLSPHFSIARSGPDSFLLTNTATNRHFQLTSRERMLIEWLKRGEPPEKILANYEA